MDTTQHARPDDRPADPAVADRFDALRRVLRARRVLEHETRTATAVPIGEVRSEQHEDVRATADDLERITEIHRDLIHQRRAARRPFHRRTDRIVLALELAERLALDRLGFADYADFETEIQRSDDVVIDLDRIDGLERELTEAERALALLIDENGAPPPLERRPRVLEARSDGRFGERSSRRRRSLEVAAGVSPGGSSGASRPPSLFDRPEVPRGRCSPPRG